MIDTNIFQDKTAVYYTLGCKLNFSETSTIGKILREAGVRTARKGEKADICVVNTCSVTEVADKKCRQAIHKLVKQHPGAFVVVTGCYAQLKPETVAKIEGVDVVLGAEQKKDLLHYLGNLQKHETGEAYTSALKDLRSFAPSCSRGDRTRFFLKVQDGCDYYCSYCTIPFARGRSRNGSIASMVEQASQAAAEGGKEIVLTGVNIGDFGKSTGETFFDLVKALDEVEGIERYRISSIEPNLLTDEIIEYVSRSRRFMPHFHIPLQSGSDEVLKLMRRRYDTALFASKIKKIKEVMPDSFIGVDVIVGTRGETEEYFGQAYEFIKSLDVTQLHVFSYSERPGTQALKIDHVVAPEEKHRRSQQLLELSDEKTRGETEEYFGQAYEFIKSLDVTQLHVFSYSERPGTQALKIDHVVAPEEKHRRSQQLLELSDEKTRAFYARHIGQTMPVLLERPKPGLPMHGFTPNYIRVEVPHDAALDNQLVSVRLGDFNADGTALLGAME
ncbi:MAG: tRNA (N(6)-L-threonylcarbamoyladenosine(37)-C(2))-methylthiotransferase MtaB [Bacteroides uniformis]|nr:tRNA (N(6)-L-threonylcarbamoyladenosine(37)-C(2))-methylthiotransferase MtaB [Bacteroides uniformis]